MKITSTINKGVFTENKKAKKDKERTSLFIITINTNKSFNCDNECAKKRMPVVKIFFEKLIGKLFKVENIPKLLAGPLKDGKNGKIDLNKIIDVKAVTKIEANLDIRGFLHSHTYIKIIHKTKVQINIPLLRKIVYNALEGVLTIDGEFKHPYINVKGLRSVEAALKNYVKAGGETLDNEYEKIKEFN